MNSNCTDERGQMQQKLGTKNHNKGQWQDTKQLNSFSNQERWTMDNVSMRRKNSKNLFLQVHELGTLNLEK
jgi:hypothetical protein